MAVFSLFDKSKSNLITTEDLEKLMISLKKNNPTAKRVIAEILEQMNLGQRQVTFQDFLEAMHSMEKELSWEEAAEAYDSISSRRKSPNHRASKIETNGPNRNLTPDAK